MVRKQELLESMQEISTAVTKMQCAGDSDGCQRISRDDVELTSEKLRVEGMEDDADEDAGAGDVNAADAIAAAFVAYGVRPIEHLMLEVLGATMMMMMVVVMVLVMVVVMVEVMMVIASSSESNHLLFVTGN
jgi:hypothetical protein